GELQWLGSEPPHFAPLPTTTVALAPAPRDLGPWLLLPLLPLALLARVGTQLLIAITIGWSLLAPAPTQASPLPPSPDEQAMQAYLKGEYRL
ncbi:hypothetical protein ACFX57_21375, partial [Aeromonas allosaccharophila]